MHLFMFLLLAVWGFLYVSGRQRDATGKPAGGGGPPSPSTGEGGSSSSSSGGSSSSGSGGVGGPGPNELFRL